MAAKDSKVNPLSSKQLIWAALVLALAFLVRLLYLLDFSSSPLVNHLILDPRFYHEMAQAIASGQTVGEEVFFKAPLYPYFLAIIYVITGESILAARLVQILLGSCSCGLIFLLARRFYSHKIALTAGIIAALYGPLIMFDAELLTPSLIVFLNLLSIGLLFRYEDTGQRRWILISALLLGLSALARPNVLVLAPGVIFWFYRYCKKERRRWKQKSLMYLAGVILMLVPLATRNYVSSGEFVLFGNYGGYNFLIGNNAQSDGKTVVLPAASPELRQGYLDAIVIANQLAGRTLDQGELGWFWFKLGAKWVTTKPADWLWLELRKLVYLSSGFEIPNNRQIYFFAERSSVLKFLLWDKFICFPFGIILPLALVAIFAGQVKRNQFLFSYFLIAYSLTVLIFFVTARFRIPLMPFLIIWASAGLWAMIDLYRKKDFQKFYRLLVPAVVAILLVNGLTFLPAFATRPLNEYESHLVLGDAYHAAGDYYKAERELRYAAQLYPRSARVFNSLGNTLSALGEDSLAADAYKRGIAVNPDYETVKKSLSELYKRANRIGDLYALVQTELDRNPNSNWVLKDWAYIHVVLEEYDQAADIYEQAYQADTTDYESLFRKADIYLNMDLRQDAEREFKRLLERLPNSIEAHANLGQVHARQGRLTEALKEFIWVKDHDEESPLGYFNLASVYYQLGSLDSAQINLNRVSAIDSTFPSLERLQQLINTARQGQP